MKSSIYNTHSWRKLRLQQLREQPLCEYCLQNNTLTPATQVDHAIPVYEKDDPLLLDSTNLLSTCARCHQLITIDQQHLNFTGLTTTEAKQLKLKNIRPIANTNGYYS